MLKGFKMSGTGRVFGGDERVNVDPNPPVAGKKATIQYRGILAKSGAQNVYLHMGYGEHNWRDIGEKVMQHKPDGTWEVTVPTDEDADRMNFCFRDNAYNWDNNSGKNWSCELI